MGRSPQSHPAWSPSHMVLMYSPSICLHCSYWWTSSDCLLLTLCVHRHSRGVYPGHVWHIVLTLHDAWLLHINDQCFYMYFDCTAIIYLLTELIVTTSDVLSRNIKKMASLRNWYEFFSKLESLPICILVVEG